MSWNRFRDSRGGVLEVGLVMVVVAVSVVAGCAPASPMGEAARPASPPRRAVEADPSRSGSLRQDQISIRMMAGDLRIEVTPLADWVLEAAAPDTRGRLVRIAQAHGPELARRSGAGEPALFLVSFSSARAGTGFQPDDLHLVSRGLRERPLAITAITPGWGSQRLSQQASEVAVYAYDGGLDLSRELTVAYQGVENSSWSNKAAVIEAERGKIPRGAVKARRPGPPLPGRTS